MALTRELAILLVQTRQFLIHLSLFLVFALTVDTFVKPRRLKRKIIVSGMVIILTIAQIAIELAAGLKIYDTIIILVCMAIYTTLQAVHRHKRRKHQ